MIEHLHKFVSKAVFMYIFTEFHNHKEPQSEVKKKNKWKMQKYTKKK